MKSSITSVVLLAACTLFLSLPGTSQQLIGGEITWECTPVGGYRFMMKLYQDCYNIDTTGTATTKLPITLSMKTTVPGISSISMRKISERELTPQCGCPGGVSYSCTGMHNGTVNMGTFTEQVYTSDFAFPNGVPLQGVPPANGWRFSFNRCCRAVSSNYQGEPNFFLQSFMYAYNNTPADVCFDNAPVFGETPISVTCTGQPLLFQHFAQDPDGDELTFNWSSLWTSQSSSSTAYYPGYGWAAPFPGPLHHNNNTTTHLDPLNGDISFTSYTPGAFMAANLITSRRNGIMIARVIREMRFLLLNCQQNNLPVHQIAPPMVQVNPNHYHISVAAGDSLYFNIQITDSDTCHGSSQPNSIWLSAAGEMFGQPIRQTSCTTPPCAHLTPSPTISSPLTAPGSLSTTFSWQTSTDHLDHTIQIPQPKTHHFYLYYQDDQCPTPAMGRILLTVEVHPWAVPPANIRCLNVLPNGDIELTWDPVKTNDSSFVKYELIASLNPEGPFGVLAQPTNMNSTSFIHTVPTIISQRYYYQLLSHINHHIVLAVPSETISSSILLTATPNPTSTNNITLDWNSTHPLPVSGASGTYQIYRNDGSGPWKLIATTTGNHYTDNLPFNNQIVRYMVETTVYDTTSSPNDSCKSISNVATVTLSKVTDRATHELKPSLYPNPAQQSVALNPGTFTGDATIRFVTMVGATAKNIHHTLKADTPFTIDITGLIPGMYLVVVSSDSDHHTLKLMIE